MTSCNPFTQMKIFNGLDYNQPSRVLLGLVLSKHNHQALMIDEVISNKIGYYQDEANLL